MSDFTIQDYDKAVREVIDEFEHVDGMSEMEILMLISITKIAAVKIKHKLEAKS